MYGRMGPKDTGMLLTRLRTLMRNVKYVREPLQAYIVDHKDMHQSEYLAACDERVAFISGFTGSRGTVVVTECAACLWTDGRYFQQAANEMDDNWVLQKEGMPSTLTVGTWLSKSLPGGARVGINPYLLPESEWRNLEKDVLAAGHHLVPINTDLVDLLWENKPPSPSNSVHPLPVKYTGRNPVKYTGKTCKEKVDNLRVQIADKGAVMFVVTALDEIAWLLNLRGSDIDYNPVFFSYVTITPTQVHLFIDESKISTAVRNHFNEEDLPVTLHPYDKIASYLTEVVSNRPDGKVWISQTASHALSSIVPEKIRLSDPSPIAVMKAIKNPVEAEGLMNAHIRDAAALCCYFAWLEKEVPKGNVTEISGATKLEEFRREQDDYVGLSFPTISSVGPNAAMNHYHPMPETDRPITTDEFYLCDSGGQYKDGTTDVTRTVHFGTPTQFEKECFTRVLKGQYFLGTAIFPNKIKGNCLDTLARKFLWDVGLDYMHGTGHGIGHYLNVHEGPMGISWRAYPDDPGLQAGMFLSNEPGYYENGKFGIRHENIMQIVPAKTPYNHNDRPFLTFETITLVPIQIKSLDPNLLTKEEISYLNNYHSLCREKVAPLLKQLGYHEAGEWLEKETEPIG